LPAASGGNTEFIRRPAAGGGFQVRVCLGLGLECSVFSYVFNSRLEFNLARTVCLIDRFHIKNHQATCFQHFNPDDVIVMNGLNTLACEECNFDINRFKFQTRHMTEYSYQLFWLNYFNFKNTNNYNL
jgi:hypothetical protein